MSRFILMRMALPAALLVTSAACHNGMRLGSEPRRRVGEYAFRISLAARDPVRGAFTIAADTVTLETDGQPCRHDRGLTGSRRIHAFSCFPPRDIDGFALTIDTQEPALSSWSGSQSVRRTRTVCVRFTTTPQGRQVCAETRSEDYFETVRIGGRLNIIAADTTSY